MENVLALFKKITTFVFDMDGVLTDGSLLVMPEGIWVRRMNIKDGYALQLAVKRGYKVVIISGSNSNEVKDRMQKLGVTDVFMKVENKAEFLNDYMHRHQIKKEEVLCMGDDIPDLGMMQIAGLAVCPNDAVQEIKSISQYISHIKGGEGCARDVIEKAMKLRGGWDNDTSVPSR
jgi:3-deoxy-D-manno-octulosonate 8-phosphate phosphatase (KDO 8-P phosphatase)